MRLLLAIASVTVVGAAVVSCTSFGEEPVAPSSEAGTGAVDGAVEAGPSPPSAPHAPNSFCADAGVQFCSDFESGDSLISQWLPEDEPVQFLRREATPAGHVMRVAILQKTWTGFHAGATLTMPIPKPRRVTYALDVRFDDTGSDQLVEVATVRTAGAGATIGFHVGIANDLFVLFEHTVDGTPDYAQTLLKPFDKEWHRFEVTVRYGTPITVGVRMDGDERIAPRATKVVPRSEPGPDAVLAVGVNHIDGLRAPLRYVIDNVTATWE